jgi:hypothetical protein
MRVKIVALPDTEQAKWEVGDVVSPRPGYSLRVDSKRIDADGWFVIECEYITKPVGSFPGNESSL